MKHTLKFVGLLVFIGILVLGFLMFFINCAIGKVDLEQQKRLIRQVYEKVSEGVYSGKVSSDVEFALVDKNKDFIRRDFSNFPIKKIDYGDSFFGENYYTVENSKSNVYVFVVTQLLGEPPSEVLVASEEVWNAQSFVR